MEIFGVPLLACIFICIAACVVGYLLTKPQEYKDELSLRLKDRLRHSREPKQSEPVAINTTPPVETRPLVVTRHPVETRPPVDWSDIAGWDRHFQTQFSDGPFWVPTKIGSLGWHSVRFLGSVRKRGGRVWFPGCGIDPGPRFYAYVGSTVLATDFSPVAVREQRRFAELAPEIMFGDWPSFVKSNAPIEKCGRFDVAEHDFTTGPPAGVFDSVINCRAFQGLSPSAMTAAARTFFAALRPGGAAMIDTINVQGKARRDVLENSLIDAGFFLPFIDSERWYRAQLESTGIIYAMVLGHPHIPYREQYPAEHFDEYAERDRKILGSFRTEYKARLAEEEPSVRKVLDGQEAKVAHVVYATG
jgi:hypothetical protein